MLTMPVQLCMVGPRDVPMCEGAEDGGFHLHVAHAGVVCLVPEAGQWHMVNDQQAAFWRPLGINNGQLHSRTFCRKAILSSSEHGEGVSVGLGTAVAHTWGMTGAGNMPK